MFLDPTQTPGIDKLDRMLRSSWLQIREDGLALAGQFTTWPEPLHNGGWSTCALKWQGKQVRPIYPWLFQKRIRNAGFSLMVPGTEIVPHVGYTDEVLRYHLGLDCPEGCGIRCGIQVGDEVEFWKDGESLLFDDTQEHSAWNRGDRWRLILLVDIEK